MYKSIAPFSRLLCAGALLAGVSACDDGGSARTSFNLSPEQLPTNLVTNGSLEASTTELTGWSAYTSEGSTAEAEFTVNTVESYRGSNSFKASIIALGDEPYHIEGGPVNVPVEAEETYAIVAWVKGPEGGKANFTASLAEDPWTTFAQKMVTFTGEWQQVSVIFTLPEAEDFTASSIRLPVQMNFAENAMADIYIDDMQLIPTDPPSAARQDIVVNGGLEQSEAGESASAAVGWDGWVNPVGSTDTFFEVDGTEAYEGENSFRVSVGNILDAGQPWHIEAGAVGIPVVEGETYTLITWTKGTVGAKANFMVQLPEDPYTTFASKEVTLTDEWQQVAFNATIDEVAGRTEPVSEVRLYVNTGHQGNAGAEVYVDNMQFYTPGEERVTNGGLEESEIGASDITGWGSGGASFTVVDDETVEDGEESNKVLQVSIGTVAGDATLYSVEGGPTKIPVTEGETYLFSARIRGTDGAQVKFNVQYPGGGYHAYHEEVVAVTEGWQDVVFKAHIRDASTIDGFEGPAAEVRLYMQMGYIDNSNADIYIDDVSFQLIEVSDE